MSNTFAVRAGFSIKLPDGTVVGTTPPAPPATVMLDDDQVVSFYSRLEPTDADSAAILAAMAGRIHTPSQVQP